MKRDPLDALFSRYVRLKSGGYCKRCGKYVGYSKLNNAHLFGRLRHTVRWDERNTVPLCGSCHYMIDNNCLAKTELLLTLMSKGEAEELERLANMTIKDHPIDKDKLKEELKRKITLLEAE